MKQVLRILNKQNVRYWSDVNRHETDLFKCKEYGNKWYCAVSGVNASLVHVSFPVHWMQLSICRCCKSVSMVLIEDAEFLIYFQHDDVPPQYDFCVREQVDEKIPGCWIVGPGTVECPPRFPDPTQVDYFKWGYLKAKVYALFWKWSTSEAAHQRSPICWTSIMKCIRKYVAMDSGHVEHVL